MTQQCLTLNVHEVSTAVFSPCRTYRYALGRGWSDAKPLVNISLNPSTADEVKNDNTIRKLIAFAKREGAGGLVMLNLFAWRSTDPMGLLTVADPVGVENDAWIERAAREAGVVVASWGSHKKLGAIVPERATQVRALLARAGVALRCFGLNGDGQPKHPLYLAASTPLIPLEGACAR